MVRVPGRGNSVFFGAVGLVLAVVVGAVAWPSTPMPETSQAEESRPLPEPGVVERSTVEPEPVAPPPPPPPRIRTCQVDPGGGGGAQVAGSVSLYDTGEVLWEVESQTPVVPASVLKLVTARAALRVLGPHYRFTTRVVAGTVTGEIWLVGGGDPTLTRTRAGTTTYYTNPARLPDLVEQVVDSLGDVPASEALVRVGIDTSRYENFPTWNDTWRHNAAALGFISPVTALMVDGGRFTPAQRVGSRTTDPVEQVSTAFIRQLGEASSFWKSELVEGQAPEGTRVLAEVMSPPLTVLVDQMIRDSDNQIAEALIREVALMTSANSFDEAAREGLDHDTPDRDVFFADDGSGLSQENVMTPALATAVMTDIARDPDAGIIVDALPSPGESGSLLRRFSGVQQIWPEVSGKTGSLSGVRSLVGIIEGEDLLVYSVFVTGSGVTDSSRNVIDNLVSQFHTCGENLAHWVPTEPGE